MLKELTPPAFASQHNSFLTGTPNGLESDPAAHTYNRGDWLLNATTTHPIHFGVDRCTPSQ